MPRRQTSRCSGVCFLNVNTVETFNEFIVKGRRRWLCCRSNTPKSKLQRPRSMKLRKKNTHTLTSSEFLQESQKGSANAPPKKIVQINVEAEAEATDEK
jgi:hypothetical protein